MVNHTHGQISENEIYVTRGNSTVLSQKFINEICSAARNKTGADDLVTATYLEQLIVMAAGTSLDDSLKATKAKRWHSKYGPYCQCKATEKYPEGDFLRQVAHSNFRSFANKVGPKNDLSLDLSLKSPLDGLTIYEYINKERIRLEAKHHDRRFEFQQDEEWKDMMFFYFLFSEFGIF